MKFKNRPNLRHELPDGRVIWESRSVAVNGVILATIKDNIDDVYILCSKRGPAVEDLPGLMNLVAGYMDWDETGPEAFIRECWEEVGLNIYDIVLDKKYKVLQSNLIQPWTVVTEPNQNKQNISLRYGLVFEAESVEDLPELSLEHNEVVGEAEDPMWLPLSQFQSYPNWAFGHDHVIINYLNEAILRDVIHLSKD